MKYQILHLSHTDIRYDSRILKQLRVLNKDYSVLAIGIDSVEGEKREKSEENFEIKSIKLQSKKIKILPRLIKHLLNFIELNLKLIKYIYQVKPKVIHCHDTTVLPIVGILSIFLDFKLIYDAHELESNRNGQGKIDSLLVLFTEKVFWDRVDALISVSESILEWYAHNLGDKKSVLILNSPELRSYRQKPQEKYNYLREKFKIPQNSKIFIYLGIIGRGRSIENYLKVFGDPKINSNIVFMGYGELTSTVIEYSNNHSNIHYHLPVKHNEVVESILDADYGLCIIPNVSLSDYYCLPNKLFEYAFSGLNILGSNFPEIEKIIKEYNLGYTCGVDIKSLKEFVNKVDSFEEKKHHNLSPLSWESQGIKLKKLYNSFDI